jgi:S-adenosylmethionine:tRNA ribosyltransferase-isomerase
MLVDDFDFELPSHLIAQRPSLHRGESRLMSVSLHGEPSFIPFSKVVDAFTGNEVLVVNDTRVVPARIIGHKPTGGRVEVFFLEQAGPNQIIALTKGKLKPGQKIHLPFDGVATFEERDELGRAYLSLDLPDGDLWSWLDQAGRIPLPPYIQRDPDSTDEERYQTIYADQPGAVAAPTAGLHFTHEIFDQLKAKGVEICSVTLHVGPGTFMPVKVGDLDQHVMHYERYEVPVETQEILKSGRPIIAVGTTVVRTLESYVRNPQADQTNLFIRPGFEFKVIDGLLTNFHLPKSTLLMLVSALAGYETTLTCYQKAIEENMHFYSYGDASLFRRPNGRWT